MSATLDAEAQLRGKPLAPATLRELSVRSNLQGAIRSASHYAAVIVTGSLIWLVSSRYGLAPALPLIALQGYFVAFLFMAVHETAHKTAFAGRALNLIVGNLSSFIILLPHEYYCLFHWDHHRYAQDPQKDPELIVGPKPGSDTELAIAYTGLQQVGGRVLLMLRHAIIGKVSVPWIPENKRKLVVAEARLYVAGYLALFAGSLALRTPMLLWLWIVPFLFGQLILRPYLYAEHTGCDEARNAFMSTRTTYTGTLMKWFAWNMPFHVEHHAYPSVPFHALPKLNAIVDDKIKFRGQGYRAVTRETWAWFRQQRSRFALTR